MTHKIASLPIRRVLLLAALIFLSLGLLALRSVHQTGGPLAPAPSATVQASLETPPPPGVALRKITALPRTDDAQAAAPIPPGDAEGEPIGSSSTLLGTSPLEGPTPSATAKSIALPGAGSEFDRPERLAPGPRDVHENWRALTEPQPACTPTPIPEVTQPPTRIVAPAIGLDAAIVPVGWKWVRRGDARVAQWQVPKNKAGWHSTSALPGLPGNTVLSGHRNIYTEVFRYLPKLEPGDEITLYAGDEAYVYIVAEKHIVKELGVPESVRVENAKWIASSDDVRLTLVTCAPYKAPGNTHRVIVVARPRDPQTTSVITTIGSDLG